MLLATATISLVFLLGLQETKANSDTTALLCNSVCWAENALAAQCEEDNDCASISNDDRYYACSNRCYRGAARCQRMCRDNFQPIYSECLGQCTDLNSYEHCMLGCFTDKMLLLKSGRNNRGVSPPPAIVEPSGL